MKPFPVIYASKQQLSLIVVTLNNSSRDNTTLLFNNTISITVSSWWSTHDFDKIHTSIHQIMPHNFFLLIYKLHVVLKNYYLA